MSQRAQLMMAVHAARTGQEQAAAVAALDAFDRQREAVIRQSRETDMSATAVRHALTPVPVHERHTAATDWLGDYTAPQDYRTDMIAQASQWYRRLDPAVAADREEFLEQARGFAYTAASRYGDCALDARRTFFEYLGYLARDAASGLPQIDQVTDPNNQPSATPYPQDVFDNFSPPQNEYNGGVESPDHQSQISSQVNPFLQQVQQQDGSGSGFGTGPEKPDEHSTSFDTSNGYAEVPLGPPGVIPTSGPGPMPQGQSSPNPVAGTMQDAGAQQRPGTLAASMRHAAYTSPDQDGYRWKISTASDEAGGGDVDPMAAPYHTRCGSSHWPEQGCSGHGEHTASVAVGYAGNMEDFQRTAACEAAGVREGIAVLRASAGDLQRVAHHHDALVSAFRREARAEDEIAWLHGYWSQVRPVLAAGGMSCTGCGKPVKGGKTQCKNCKQAARTGSRLDFQVAAEAALARDAASQLTQVQQTVSPDNVPTPQADQLPPDVMFPIDPAFAQQWETGPEGAQPRKTGSIYDYDPDSGGERGYRAFENPPGTNGPAPDHSRYREYLDSGEPGTFEGWWARHGQPGNAREGARSTQPSMRAVRMFGHMDAMEGKRAQHKDGYPFSPQAHGQYVRSYAQTRAGIDARGGRGPMGASDFADMTGRRDLHQHYLGAFYDAGGRTPEDAGWDSGSDASRQRPVTGHLASLMLRPRSTWSDGELRFVADYMSRPLQTTDDQNPPFNSAQTTPPPQGTDYKAGFSEGQEDARNGEAPTFSDNSSRVSPYVKGYSEGFGGSPAGAGPQDVPRSMGGDSGQPQNAQEAATSFQVSKASLQRSGGRHGAPGPADRCPGCGGHDGNHASTCKKDPAYEAPSDDWAFESALRHRVSAAFITREAGADPDFRKGYRFAYRWQQGSRLVSAGSAAFEAGLYAGMSDRRPAVQGAWVAAHRAGSRRHGELAARIRAHAAFSRQHAQATGMRMTGAYLVPRVTRQGATSTDLITDGPGSSPDPMGSTPLNGPGTVPPMGGGEDPARSGGPSPYQGAQPAGSGPVAPDDVLGQPQEPPQQGGPFTQTFSGRHPGNADLAPVAPDLAAQPGYQNTEAYQGDPRQQRAMAFRQRVQSSLAER